MLPHADRYESRTGIYRIRSVVELATRPFPAWAVAVSLALGYLLGVSRG